MTKLAQIKKFYQKNEKHILVCSGIVLGSITTAHFASHALDGMTLVNADLYSIPDRTEKVLRVTLKNGSIRDYIWNYTDAVKS